MKNFFKKIDLKYAFLLILLLVMLILWIILFVEYKDGNVVENGLAYVDNYFST